MSQFSLYLYTALNMIVLVLVLSKQQTTQVPCVTYYANLHKDFIYKLVLCLRINNVKCSILILTTRVLFNVHKFAVPEALFPLCNSRLVCSEALSFMCVIPDLFVMPNISEAQCPTPTSFWTSWSNSAPPASALPGGLARPRGRQRTPAPSRAQSTGAGSPSSPTPGPGRCARIKMREAERRGLVGLPKRCPSSVK